MAERVRAYAPQSDNTLLKLIDEYNYSKYKGMDLSTRISCKLLMKTDIRSIRSYVEALS